MTEDEIKIKISKTKAKSLIKNLVKLGARKEFCIKQITHRFDSRDNLLAKQGIFLRTREGEINSLTLKRKLAKDWGKIKSREETEINIGQRSQLKSFNKIIKMLGFNKQTVMEKYRQQWSFKGFKIAIDELSFGFYVEIEGNRNKLFKIAEMLKLSKNKIVKGTYWDLFKEYNQKYKLKNSQDIKFSTRYKSFLKTIC